MDIKKLPINKTPLLYCYQYLADWNFEVESAFVPLRYKFTKR